MQTIITGVCFALCLTIGNQAHAKIRTEPVEYTHDGVLLEGYLAFDDAVTAKRPGVLVVHEWWGLNDYARRRARQLAELGYLGFALDMYGKGKSTTEPAQARAWSGQFRVGPLPAQRARAGLEVLFKHERVDPKRLAAIGYCFGGSVVLKLAYSGVDIAGVVSFHGSLPAPGAAAPIKTRILVCHGAEDPLVPAPQLTAFKNTMRQSGADWQLISYGGAVHSFTNPKADQAGIAGVSYNERADRRSWRHMKMFFDELFGE